MDLKSQNMEASVPVVKVVNIPYVTGTLGTRASAEISSLNTI